MVDFLAARGSRRLFDNSFDHEARCPFEIRVTLCSRAQLAQDPGLDPFAPRCFSFLRDPYWTYYGEGQGICR